MFCSYVLIMLMNGLWNIIVIVRFVSIVLISGLKVFVVIVI